MRVLPIVAAVLAVLCVTAEGRKGFGEGGQEYGYVDVREGAHMFYWLYYVKGGDSHAGQPLVIWLQGGPGAASTSFGNFEEIGPLKGDLTPRNTSWVDHVNVLFLDNPVGTGFSYVDRSSLIPTTNKAVALDLVEFMRGFLKIHPQFRQVPLYIFSESYGGKMAAEFALYLNEEMKSGSMEVNLQGVGLGDSWISPVDSVMTWAPYLLHTGMVDSTGYKTIMESAKRTKLAIQEGRWNDATSLWSSTERVIMSVSPGVDFYNILSRSSSYKSQIRNADISDPKEFLFRILVQRASDFELEQIMNNDVRKALGVIPSHVRHSVSSGSVFNALWQDFMKPVTNVVERLLNETSIKVVVFTGQLDLIVDTPGTLDWAERLNWPQAKFWVNQAPRRALVVDGILEGFVKSAGKFYFYWINRAGHMVPSDNPQASIEMLRQVTGFN